MNRQMMHFDDLEPDDLVPLDEIENDESDGIETAVEMELLLARMQATRFAGV